MRMDAPYDPDAPYGNKRRVTWTGYKGPMTETCDDATLHVMTPVATTDAAVTDVTMTEPRHQALANTQCAPESPSVDAGSGVARWPPPCAHTHLPFCRLSGLKYRS